MISVYKLLFSENARDVSSVIAANNSWLAIHRLLTTTKNLKLLFSTGEDGRLLELDLHKHLPRPEHEGVYLHFADVRTYPDIGGLEGSVSLPDEGNTVAIILPLKGAPKTRDYNNWFVENVALKFKRARSTYIHELTHALDFRRVSSNVIDFVFNKEDQTTDRFNGLRQQIQQLKADNPLSASDYGVMETQLSGLEQEINKAYFNNPFELNAFYKEGLHQAIRQLKRGKLSVGSPQEFVDKFMDAYIPVRMKNSLTPTSVKRLTKRLASIYPEMQRRYA